MYVMRNVGLAIVVLLNSVAAIAAAINNFNVMVAWANRVQGQTHQYSLGSSFMIAMKRYNYSEPFTLMPLYCHDQLSLSTATFQVSLFFCAVGQVLLRP